MLVQVRPIPLKKWHEKTGRDSFTQPKVIEVLYDTKLGAYATGLTKEEEEKYSKILGVDLSDRFIVDQPHPYWSTKPASIKLENKTVIFNTENPTDFVRVKNLKASKYVANSMREYEEGLFPEATHVIYDETEEAAEKSAKFSVKVKAMKLYTKMSADEKVNIIQILSDKTLRGRSDDFIDGAMEDLIENRTDDFIRYAQMDKDEVYVRAAILEGISRNILTKEGLSIFYMSELIGHEFEDAVKWFKDPQNSKMKVAILEKLTN